MRRTTLLATLALTLPAPFASASNIYIIASGDPATDNAAIAALTSRGHTCTLGVTYMAFDGTQSLTGFQTVYLQNNYRWGGYMPGAGQQALASWVMSGGRLVTCEWCLYYSYSNGPFGALSAMFPASRPATYGNASSTTYDQATPNAAINAGVPASLTFPLNTYSGTESYCSAKPGATTYYTSQGLANAVGLTGWGQGAGSVFSFSTTCGPAQLADPNFGRLFSNVMAASAPPPPATCYANCDGSIGTPVLTVQDFGCFLNRFAAGDSYANCDGSTTAPVLTVQDFGCFLNRFAAGCS
jgi:hypothetical protein